MKKFAQLVLMIVFAATAAAAQNSSGTVNATIINKSGIAIVFNNDPTGVALGGAGSSAASMNLGTVSYFMTTPPAGVTIARNAAAFTVSSPFHVHVIVGGVASPSYNLTAALQSVPGVFSYAIDAVALSTTAATIVAAAPNYGVDVQHTFKLTVPRAAPAGAVNNTVNFTVTAN